jgi:hypothetical protein
MQRKILEEGMPQSKALSSNPSTKKKKGKEKY